MSPICFKRVAPVQVVVGRYPRIAPALQSPAQDFAAEVPVVTVRNGHSVCLTLVKAIDHTDAPGGGLRTSESYPWLRRLCGAGRGKTNCAVHGQRTAVDTAKTSAKQTLPSNEAFMHMRMCSQREYCTAAPPASLGREEQAGRVEALSVDGGEREQSPQGGTQRSEQDYLVSDTASARTRAGHASGHDQHPSIADSTTSASERASAKGRVTLAPRLHRSDVRAASAFHRALDHWNAQHGTTLTFEELTEIQQKFVQLYAKRIAAEEHPCPRR